MDVLPTSIYFVMTEEYQCIKGGRETVCGSEFEKDNTGKERL